MWLCWVLQLLVGYNWLGSQYLSKVDLPKLDNVVLLVNKIRHNFVYSFDSTATQYIPIYHVWEKSQLRVKFFLLFSSHDSDTRIQESSLRYRNIPLPTKWEQVQTLVRNHFYLEICNIVHWNSQKKCLSKNIFPFSWVYNIILSKLIVAKVYTDFQKDGQTFKFS